MSSRRAPASRRSIRERAGRYDASDEPVVVDASIACVWFVDEPERESADRLLESRAPMLAPDLMAAETANALWKKLRRREMDRVQVEQAVTNLLALGITWTPSAALLRPAVSLAAELGHPLYDCLYLALAGARSVRLATLDKRLQGGAERLGIRLWR